MSDHYCCRQCGQRYDVCRCPSPLAPPDKSLEQWYVIGDEFMVVQGKALDGYRRMLGARFDTREQAELHAYQSIGSRIEELQYAVDRLKTMRSNHPANKSQ